MFVQNVRKLFILNSIFPNSFKTKLLNITLKPFICPTINCNAMLSFQVVGIHLLE